jgi:predicted N-acyltransferase
LSDSAPAPLRLQICDDLGQVPAADWDRLVDPRYPFLRHSFLAGLERHGCLGERYGWLPRHLLLHDPKDRLVGAAPLYLKFNSYGEFVFDWAWADAYQRQGMAYYPKLVSASPYTPATGPKLLRAPDAPAGIETALIEAAQGLAEELQVSSLHWLFTPKEQTERLRDAGLMIRTGCQFHWQNRGYTDFDHYLSHFSSAKRKQVRRERRRVAEAGVSLRRLHGDQATEGEWALFHRLYEDTFDRKGGLPTLSLDFFLALAEQSPESVLLVLAEHGGEPVAAAFNLVGADALYGRHWGCRAQFHSLHFEACYYQGLDYCIERGLAHFEPGAQGEHKISRGFLPTETWSAHWLAHPGFSAAVADFLARETRAMNDYMAELAEHSPFKAGA